MALELNIFDDGRVPLRSYYRVVCAQWSRMGIAEWRQSDSAQSIYTLARRAPDG